MATRSYNMAAREQAMQQTRESILDAAEACFDGRWYDEVTLADVAATAGVSQQTVVNHFGGKMQLYLAGVTERVSPRIRELRGQARLGDVASVVETAVADYERTGDGTLRMLALADRYDELGELARAGRKSHRGWVTTVLAPQIAGRAGARRARLVHLLVTALDVTVWRSLRRDQGLSRQATEQHLLALVTAVLESA
jgi:AcrR family transcriptional regulator